MIPISWESLRMTGTLVAYFDLRPAKAIPTR